MARVQYTLNSCEITILLINHLLLNGSSIISTFVTVCKPVSDLYIHEHLIILVNGLKKIEDICVKHQNTVGWYSSGSVTSVNFEIKGLSKSHGPLFRSTSKAIILQRN